MGPMRHHAMIVTTHRREYSLDAYKTALEIFGDDEELDQGDRFTPTSSGEFLPLVSPIADSVTNGYSSFAIFPDGSKEGWEESNRGDKRRATLQDWLRSPRHGYDESMFEWVEVIDGDDAGEESISAGSFIDQGDGDDDAS